jgi:hypothetical protein
MHEPAHWADKGLSSSQSFTVLLQYGDFWTRFRLIATPTVYHRLTPLKSSKAFDYSTNSIVDQSSKPSASEIDRLSQSNCSVYSLVYKDVKSTALVAYLLFTS